MSEPIPVFTGHVTTSGKLEVDDRHEMARYIRSLGGWAVDVTIKKHRAQRSSRANRYYHGVVVALLAEHCGYDHDDMHEALAFKFLRIEDCPITGAPRRKRTPATDSKEFGEYVDACIRLAAELGVVIPEPDRAVA